MDRPRSRTAVAIPRPAPYLGGLSLWKKMALGLAIAVDAYTLFVCSLTVAALVGSVPPIR